MKKAKYLYPVLTAVLTLSANVNLQAQMLNEAEEPEIVLEKVPDDPGEVPIPLSVEEEKVSEWSFYPNPARDQLTVEFPGERPDKLYIYSMVGKPVLEMKVTEGRTQVAVSNLKPGVYFLKAGDKVHRFSKV